MKAKLITASAFSLLLAVGAATAQSTSDGMSNSNQSGVGAGAQTGAGMGAQQQTAPGGQQIDPGVTNSTTNPAPSTTGDTGANPDCDSSTALTGEPSTSAPAPQQNADGTVSPAPAC